MNKYSLLLLYFIFSSVYIVFEIFESTNSFKLVICQGLLMGLLGIIIYFIIKGLAKLILAKGVKVKIESLERGKLGLLDMVLSGFVIAIIIELIDIISEGEQIFKIIYEIPSIILLVGGLGAVGKVMGNYFSKRKVDYSKTIKVNTNLQIIFNLSLEALGEIKGCTVKEKNREVGSIQAEVDLNPRSFGEEIEIKLESLGNNQTAVDITSECKEESFEDFYKNYSNVMIIINYLKENI